MLWFLGSMYSLVSSSGRRVRLTGRITNSPEFPSTRPKPKEKAVRSSLSTSSLDLEGLHAFIAGAAEGIGRRTIEKFLEQGCKVTAHDNCHQTSNSNGYARLNAVTCNLSDEESIRSGFEQANERFGPVNILIVNAGMKDECNHYPIWDIPLDIWEENYRVNVRGAFLTIKHFLLSARAAQQSLGRDLENLSIVVVGSRQEGHADYGSAAAVLHYGLVTGVKDEIARLNYNARINTVAPGRADMHTTGWLHDSKETEAQTTYSKPEDVARSITFLASHRAAGHISGQILSVHGCRESYLVWKENGPFRTAAVAPDTQANEVVAQSIPESISKPKRNKIRIAVSVDLDAVSGWLGTGQHSDNILADDSSGFFAAKVDVPRLLRMLKKLDLANRCTWFIPGHSAESFPEEVRDVVDTGCENGLHGYAHKGAYQLTVEQERDVLTKCIDIATNLTGKRPAGYRAPLYQLRESTLDLLEEFGFEYDASLTDHDCHPFFAPKRLPIKPIDFSLPASSWMHPVPQPTTDRRPLVCVPCNWYMEDMTPMQYLPHVNNSHGYVDVRVIENLWRDRFLWIRENEGEPVFPILMHPDTSGMGQVIGMLERMLKWLKGRGDEVEFCQTGEIARWWREKELESGDY